MTNKTAPQSAVKAFQQAGYRKEASILRTENRKMKEQIEQLTAENLDLRDTITSRFTRIIIPREVKMRRELLITLHNSLEHIRAFGVLTPHWDHLSVGFDEHRTLHRSCNKFEDLGILKKIKSNPSSFVIDESWVE